jgi:hypothetical protein
VIALIFWRRDPDDLPVVDAREVNRLGQDAGQLWDRYASRNRQHPLGLDFYAATGPSGILREKFHGQLCGHVVPLHQDSLSLPNGNHRPIGHQHLRGRTAALPNSSAVSANERAVAGQTRAPPHDGHTDGSETRTSDCRQRSAACVTALKRFTALVHATVR